MKKFTSIYKVWKWSFLIVKYFPCFISRLLLNTKMRVENSLKRFGCFDRNKRMHILGVWHILDILTIHIFEVYPIVNFFFRKIFQNSAYIFSCIYSHSFMHISILRRQNSNEWLASKENFIVLSWQKYLINEKKMPINYLI